MNQDPEPLEHGIDPSMVPLLFSLRGVDIDEKTEEGCTMLHMAVQMRDIEVATVLLGAGASVNVKDNENNTPLSLAIDIGYIRMVELLLQHNPNFNLDIVREKFYTSLASSSSDDEKIVKCMIQNGFTVKETDDANSTVIWSAILLCLEEVAVSLVNYNRDCLKHVEAWYRSFLLHTQPFTSGQTEMLRIIMKIKDLFMQETDIQISDNHNFDLFKLLLSEYEIDLINVNLMSVRGSLDDNQETAILILTTGILESCYHAERPVCDEKGRTGLHYAAKVGNVAVIQSLLDMQLDINAKDDFGKTPLNYIYDRIIELSPDNNNDEASHNVKHFDPEFQCWFTLMDLKIGAIILLKHISKLISLNVYMTLGNLKITQTLLNMMNKDEIITSYYLTVFGFLESCESEVKLLKEKMLGEISYYGFLTKNRNQIAFYTKKQEVIQALQLSDKILEEFEIYGPMLKHQFNVCNIRRGLIENAESILFDIMKWKRLPLIAVREILSNLTNDELCCIVLNA